jgi:hypothetical protein
MTIRGAHFSEIGTASSSAQPFKKAADEVISALDGVHSQLAGDL